MKKIIFSLFSLVFFFGTAELSAQDRKLKKIRSKYEDGDYEKCIKLSDKYLEDNYSEALPYFMQGFSYFELFKQKNENDLLLDGARILNRGIARRKSEVFIAEYPQAFNDMKDSLESVGNRIYKQEPDKSKLYYKYLAEIYNDTTIRYRELYIEADRPDSEIIKAMREGRINQTDKEGRKQGLWKKVYDNGNTAYEVTFKDDKPVGEMVRYHRNSRVMARMEFEEDGKTAYTKLYDKYGNFIAEGKYLNKQKEGEWKYYQDEALIQKEHYKNGKRDGEQKIFYSNGNLYDIKHFENGTENGMWIKYHRNGKEMLKAEVADGELNGNILRWYPSGQQEVIGQYENDLPVGTWTYFSDDGKNKETITYKDGVPENIDEIEEKQAEEYQKTLEMSKRLVDPQNFKGNPEEYNRIIQN